MNLTNIFSLSTIICLGVSFLLIAIVGIFFMQRLNEQNHKISSMLSLVSTMADEVNNVKSYVQTLSLTSKMFQNGGLGSSSFVEKKTDPLINVSDDDSKNSEDIVDDSESDAGDSESDSESDESESDESNTNDTENNDNNNKKDESEQNIRKINMSEIIDINLYSEAIIENENEN